ncbi:hypothetical protein [Micromonospora sp. NPDC049645]|uniref:hypothetical protein n=1 Tax=Micromonospora sp. NPDC049645 TaxID=3155508 RepID=UPI003423E02C
MTENVAPDLAAGLGTQVAAVLNDWAELHDRYYELDHWLVNGRSRAPVAVVTETDLSANSTVLLVLKVLTVDSGGLRGLEYRRHRQAVAEAGRFARHLSRIVHEAVPVGTDRWITFQSVAGDTLGNSEVLTVLLRRMLNIPAEPESVQTAGVECDPPTFAAACAALVRGVLHDWAGPPFSPPHESWDLPTFFRRHIFDQLAPGGRLHPWALRHQGRYLQLPEERHPLPSPFAVARGEFFDPELVIRPLVGRTHGDLHTDNALIQVRPSIAPDAFYLIDIALYENRGPVTRDPAHLVLYILARFLEQSVVPAHHGLLIELLLDPVGTQADQLPRWLTMLIRQIDDEAVAWIRRSGLEKRWRAQSLLSLAACALLFLGRSSTPEASKPFFLRLAARAVARYAEVEPDAVPARDPVPTVGASPTGDQLGWIDWLCREWPQVRAAALARDRVAEAEAFRADALGKLDRADDFVEFVRELGGPEPDVRWGTRGREGQPEEEAYLCPIDLCPRRERRAPGGAVPVCHLTRDDQRRLRSSLG